MKKFLSIALSLAMIAVLAAGCGDSNSKGKEAEQAPATGASREKTTGGAGEGQAPVTKAQVDLSNGTGGETQRKAIPKPTGGYKIGFTCMDASNPFFVTIEKEIRSKAEANGDQLITADPANDVQRQITQIEDMISQKIVAIFINPAEAEGISPAIDELKKAGVIMINFDTQVAKLQDMTSYIGSDNVNAGKVCGEDLVKKCPDGGDIIVLDSPTMNSVVDRTNGFLVAIKGHEFNIVAQQDAKGNLEQAMKISEDLLQAHPNVVAIFGGNDPTALGALAAANAAGLKKCKIYGVDGSPDFKSELSKPNTLLEATGAQSPITIADTSVEVLYNYLKGDKIFKHYPVKTFLIDKNNVNQFGTKGWQ